MTPNVMLNSFQHLTASLYLPPLFLGEILKQVQDDFGRFLLFPHSFWAPQFNTYVKSHNSQLIAHRSMSNIFTLVHKTHIGSKMNKNRLK